MSREVGLRFEELFREYFSPLCYFARKYVPDFDASREIVHAVFVAIWEKRAEFDFNKPAKSYLFTAVYNRCMNHIRDRKKFSDTEISDDMHPMDPDETGNMEAAELEGRIWRVIDSLPEKCREVFILNRFENKKYAEIAEHLKISVKTVETQMSKALKVLRDNLADYIHLLWIFMLRNLF